VPVTTMGDFVLIVLRAAPPLLEVHDAVYPVIAEPPFAGAVNETLMRASPAVAVGGAGRLGTVLGTTAADAADAGPAPAPLTARTVHVYVRPFVTPATVIGEDALPANRAAPPLLDVQLAV